MRSVALAAYQGMPYIRQQLDSILVQMLPEDELVISDNGSTDGTWEYLMSEAKRDSRIRLFTLSAPKGVVPNFQNALEHCSGDIIYLSDQDDIWKSHKMERIGSLFAADPKLLAVQGDAELIDGENRPAAPSFFALRKCGPGVWKNYRKNTWQGCSMAFRRELLAAVLPFPAKIPMHDMWIGIIAELAGDVLFLPEVLISYRRHENNRSADSRAGWGKVILWRIRLGWAILRRRPSLRRFCRAKGAV